ncbi:polysaccharide pyruvyl transferase family protein [uncultured Draconibacterium sp.]|uniref:polysaccharide pyruvyl transferase family protein n=1 Tax=uncultured Draconibacterium sp. TaxID=1573823 RepID=UPI002AA7E3CE|nr:polysaccharide pyruvyl transferase family protein [uncultured Draconibacterium sp.]
MKIGIVSLPFNWNYGGILQTWALQQVLADLGHEGVTINRNTVLMPLKMKILSFTRRLILTILGKKVVVRTWPTKKEEKIIRQHTDRFIAENVTTTHLFKSEKDFSKLNDYKFNAYIVGSDQVWRPKYSPNLENHFLGFLPESMNVKRIAYAASFGVDNWEFSSTQTSSCARLVHLFDGISVREDSAVELCKEHFGVMAEHVLDPTLLVDAEKYVELVKKDKVAKMPGTLFNYVLDITDEKKQFIDDASAKLGLKAFSSTAAGEFRMLGKKRLEECVFPPITQWIRSFMDAEFVITDSFHGTAFSIIFNKPFIAIGNKKRGISRFSSLLKLFGLEDRLIYDFGEDALQKVSEPMDYTTVNEKLMKKRAESIRFLKMNLTTD